MDNILANFITCHTYCSICRIVFEAVWQLSRLINRALYQLLF